MDGPPGSAGKYTRRAAAPPLPRRRPAQFFRLDEPDEPRIETLGDCGAFSYVREEIPPYTVDEVIDFYDECGFDYGISRRPRDPRLRPRPPTSARTAPQPSGLAAPPAAHARTRRRVPAPPRAREGPLRATRRRAGLESRVVRARGPSAAGDRLRAHRARRHGPAEDARDPGLPASNRRRSAHPRRSFHLLGVTRSEQHLGASRATASRASTAPRRSGRRSRTTATTTTRSTASTSRSASRRSTATPGSSDGSAPANIDQQTRSRARAGAASIVASRPTSDARDSATPSTALARLRRCCTTAETRPQPPIHARHSRLRLEAPAPAGSARRSASRS